MSGSLRRASTNSALVEAARRLAPPGVDISIYRGLSDLPPFNPDVDDEGAPAPVTSFRALLRGSRAILISSPEYAHGVPGALKNALDWVVGSGELIDKPVALVNTSARATHAWASLAETLTVMSAHLVREASVVVSLGGSGLDAAAIVADAAMSAALRLAIDSLADAARKAPLRAGAPTA